MRCKNVTLHKHYYACWKHEQKPELSGKHYNIWGNQISHTSGHNTQFLCVRNMNEEPVDSHLSHQRTSVTEAPSVLLATSGLGIRGPKRREMTFANVTSDEHLCKGSFPIYFFFKCTEKPDIPSNHQTEHSFSACYFGIFAIVMKYFLTFIRQNVWILLWLLNSEPHPTLPISAVERDGKSSFQH